MIYQSPYIICSAVLVDLQYHANTVYVAHMVKVALL